MENTKITLEQLTSEIINIIADRLGLENDSVLPENDLVKDLGADSLDIVELIMDIEGQYGVHLSDEVAEKIKTINDVIHHVHVAIA